MFGIFLKHNVYCISRHVHISGHIYCADNVIMMTHKPEFTHRHCGCGISATGRAVCFHLNVTNPFSGNRSLSTDVGNFIT